MMAVDKSGYRVRRMFGQIAGRYDLLNHLLSLNIDRYWRWRAVRAAPPTSELPVLDVCTGTGDLAIAFSKKCGGRLPVIGTDFCHPMLKVAVEKSGRAASGSTMHWVEADAQHLPFPDRYFQIVSVAFGLRNVADTDRGLCEMARVCVPGGTVVVLEFSTPVWQPLRALYGFYFRTILPRIGQLLARNHEEAYNYLPASVGEFPQGEQLAARMRAAGLEDVRWFPLTLGVATLYLGTSSSS